MKNREKVCAEGDCGRMVYSKGLCKRCYARSVYKKGPSCKSDGCGTRALYTGGYCQAHALEARGVDLRRYRKNVNLWSSYRIKLDQVEDLLTKQGGVCAVCREKMQDPHMHLSSTDPSDLKDTGSKSEVWVVDHCHKTGKVRGIVHQRCNVAVGAVLEDPKKAYLVAKYVESFLT